MPRSLKIPCKLLKHRKYSPPKHSMFKEQPAPVIPICKAFKFPETEYPKLPTFLEPCCTKYKATETVNNNSNTMCKCPKSSKIMHTIKADKKKQNNNTTTLLEPNKSAPLPFCFNGNFPETEYPLNIAETWSPKYWTQLPNTEMKKCSTPICNQDTENIIKTTNTAIEKALDALLRSQQTSSLLADTCSLNSQTDTEFLISDQGNTTLITHSTSTPIVPQALDIRDLEQNKPNNDKSACINANKSNGRDSAIKDGLPNKSIIPSFGESNSKNENDLPIITTDSSTKLVPSGESNLYNESSNEAPVGTDLSSIEALLNPVIPTGNIESVVLVKDSLSTIHSIENISVPPITPAVLELEHSDADSEIPEKRDPNADSVVSDSSIPKSNSVSGLPTLDEDSSVQHYIDKTTTETTIPNTLEFIAPMKPLNPEKDNLLQGLSVPESNSLPLISPTPNYNKSIVSEVDSSPSIPSVSNQEKGDLPSESVVKETCGAHLSTAMSSTMSTVPDTNDSSTDLKTLANGDSSLESVLHTNDSHTSLAYPIADAPGGSSAGADATLPEITSIPQNSKIPDTNDSNDEHCVLSKDDAPLDITRTNTDDFPSISHADIATNDISVPSATIENAGKSSSLKDLKIESASVTPNIMEIQEYDYTTMSPFYNDLEADSFNNDPEKEMWILDPNDKEYLIVW